MLLVCIAIVALGRLRYGFMSFDFTLVEGVRVGVYQILPFVLGLFAHAHGLFRIDSIMLVIFLEGNQAGESETCREAPKEGYENAISVGPYTSARSSQWKTTETNYRFSPYGVSILVASGDTRRSTSLWGWDIPYYACHDSMQMLVVAAAPARLDHLSLSRFQMISRLKAEPP